MPTIYKLSQDDGTRQGDLYNGFTFYSVNVLRTYSAGFLSMFTNIKVRRYAPDFITIAKLIDVPVKFGGQSKEHYEREENYTNEGGRQSYQTMPAIAVKFTSPSYASSRVKASKEPRVLYQNGIATNHQTELMNAIVRDIEPVPYDYNFSVEIKTNRSEDMLQILEQILPYQSPNRFLRIKEIPFFNVERDINVVLESVQTTWSDEMTSEANRIHTATLEFRLEGYMYRPVTSAHVMANIYLYIYSYDGNVDSSQLDRRERFLLAPTQADIPPNAHNVTPYHDGTFLYQLTDAIDL